jgi:hypothetical protein
MVLILADAVDQLLNGERREQLATAQKLKMLALQDVNRPAIADAGAIEPLVDLLGSDDPEMQEEAAAALRSLAVGQGAIRQRIVRVGALPHVLSMLRSGVEEVPAGRSPQSGRVAALRRVRQRQEQAAGLLKTLAMHRESANAIAASGSIPPLVALLESGDAGAQQDAAAALRNLASTSDAAVAAVGEARGVPSLVALLSTPAADVASASAGALRALARDPEQAAAIRAACAVPLLESLHSSATASRELRAEARGALILLVPPSTPSNESSPRSISAEHH